MKTVKVTKLEAELLQKIANGLYAEHGYSDIDLADVSEDIQRDKGVLASLVKKDIVYIWVNRAGQGDPVNFDGLMICDGAIQAVRDFTGKNFWSDFEGESAFKIERSPDARLAKLEEPLFQPITPVASSQEGKKEKLTPAQVAEIRESKDDLATLASRFNRSKSLIYKTKVSRVYRG